MACGDVCARLNPVRSKSDSVECNVASSTVYARLDPARSKPDSICVRLVTACSAVETRPVEVRLCVRLRGWTPFGAKPLDINDGKDPAVETRTVKIRPCHVTTCSAVEIRPVGVRLCVRLRS